MAHFSYIGGSLGAWAIGTTITPAKLWQWDQNQYAAINGDGGGTWSPTAKIVIGGANGLELSSSPLILSGTASLTVGVGGVTFNGALSVTGGVSMSHSLIDIGSNSAGTVSIKSLLRAKENTLCEKDIEVIGDTILGVSDADSLSVNATSTFVGESNFDAALLAHNNVVLGDSNAHSLEVNAEATFNSAEFHNGAASFAGTTEFSAASTFTSTANFNGNVNLGNTKADIVAMKGRMTIDVERVGLSIANTRDGDCADRIIVTGTPGVICSITFTSTNATEGLVKRISKQGGSDTVKIGDGVSTLVLADLVSVGDSCEICFSGGRWYKS